MKSNFSWRYQSYTVINVSIPRNQSGHPLHNLVFEPLPNSPIQNIKLLSTAKVTASCAVIPYKPVNIPSSDYESSTLVISTSTSISHCPPSYKRVHCSKFEDQPIRRQFYLKVTLVNYNDQMIEYKNSLSNNLRAQLYVSLAQIKKLTHNQTIGIEM